MSRKDRHYMMEHHYYDRHEMYEFMDMRGRGRLNSEELKKA